MAVGDVIGGKYRVDHVLGEGGMGLVVAVTHLELEHRFAIKILKPALAARPDVVARFTREARAAVKVKSQHVARVHDVGTLPSGVPYMVMEHLEGEDLGQLLARRGPLPAREAVALALEAAEAIEEAHALGIVHRDLKPGNLFLAQRSSGKPILKVLDFGISKVATPAPSPAITSDDALVGSPGYMSPEQMVAAKTADQRSDVWSLGVVLYEMLSGRRPFVADTMPELVACVIANAHDDLRPIRPELPAGLCAAIDRCLEKEAADRFASMNDLVRALLPFAPPPSSTNETSPADTRDDECLDEADIAAFVGGTLEASARAKVELHLDSCDACRELVAVLAADQSRERRNDPSSAPPPDPALLSAGALVADRFRVIEPLGAGATATTYKVRDEKLDVDLALKVLLDHSAGATRRIERELGIARKLSHPNVCRVHDVGRTDELDFFSMELVDGETLEAAMKRGIPEAAIPNVLDQICAGMEAVHAQGIVHRDLKPSNILVEKETGRVVLTDFGLAQVLDSEQSRGRIVGTPAYWAPEQARGEEASKASDVYSFGLIAYKMFTRRAYKLSDPRALERVPRRYRTVVERCLEASPSARFADASAVRAALGKRPRADVAWVAAGVVLAAIVGGVVALRVTPSAPEGDDRHAVELPPPITAPSTSSASIASAVNVATSPPASASAAAAFAPAASSSARVQKAPRASAKVTPSATSSATKPETDLLYKR